MRRSMLAVVSVLVLGCGGVPGDGESTQGDEVPDVQTDSEPSTVSALKKTSTSFDGRASVTFESSGDKFYIQDTAADGRSAAVHIVGYGYLWNSKGAGTTAVEVYNLPEGITIKFKACYGEKNDRTSIKCGSAKEAKTK